MTYPFIRRCGVMMLCLLLLFSSLVLAEGSGNSMTIVNCEEWVSLRQKPDTSSERLCKIPLGETVTNCQNLGNGFFYCEYGSLTGYILAEYLESASLPEGGSKARFSYDDLAQQAGMTLRAYAGEYTVLARRIFAQDGETLRVGAFSGSFEAIWGYETISSQTGEFPYCEAFIGGTKETPCVMVYNAQIGLTRLNSLTGNEEWTLKSDSISFGHGISAAVSENGTMYIAARDTSDVTAISRDGAILWRSQPENGLSGASSISVSSDGGADVGYSEDSVMVHFQPDGKCTDVSAARNTPPASAAAASSADVEITPGTLLNTHWYFSSPESGLNAEFSFASSGAALSASQGGTGYSVSGMTSTFTIGSLYDDCPNNSWWAWLDCKNADLRYTCYRREGQWILELQGSYRGTDWPEAMRNKSTFLFTLGSGAAPASNSSNSAASSLLWANLNESGWSAKVLSSEGFDDHGDANEVRLLNGNLTVASCRTPILDSTGEALDRLALFCGEQPDSLSYVRVTLSGLNALRVTHTGVNNNEAVYGDAIILSNDSMTYFYFFLMPANAKEQYTSFIEKCFASLYFANRTALKAQ